MGVSAGELSVGLVVCAAKIGREALGESILTDLHCDGGGTCRVRESERSPLVGSATGFGNASENPSWCAAAEGSAARRLSWR